MKRIMLFGALVILTVQIAGCSEKATDPAHVTPTVGLHNTYDCIVVGSDPEGIAAGVAAARSGLKTLLIDRRPEIGGLITRGWLNTLDMNYGPKGELLTCGIFLEFYRQLEGDSFDIDTALRALQSLVAAEDNLTVLLSAQDIDPLVQDGTVTGISYTKNNARHQLSTKTIIDATQDADIAAQVGVPYTVGQEDFGGPPSGMAATLVFKLGGVTEEHWSKLTAYIKEVELPHTGANRRSAWGFPNMFTEYVPQQPDVQLRGLNIGRQNDDSVLINALQIFGVNPFSLESRLAARNKGLAELEHIVPFLKQHIPGFEDAYLAGTAPELYIRESRHIIGEYRLTIDDVLENRDFSDRIAFGSYPVDVQATHVGHYGYVVGNPKKYAIPLRCLVPKKINGLLVVGRSASYDSLAHGSTRVIPVGMCTGQAAGIACAVAIENGVSLRQLVYNSELMAAVQQRLEQLGQPLDPFTIPNPLENHPHYEGLKFVRALGLVSAGYSNTYSLEKPMPGSFIADSLPVLAVRAGWCIQWKPVNYSKPNITLGKLAVVLTRNYLAQEKQSPQTALKYLRSNGLWASGTLANATTFSELNRGQVYSALYDFHQWLQKRQSIFRIDGKNFTTQLQVHFAVVVCRGHVVYL